MYKALIIAYLAYVVIAVLIALPILDVLAIAGGIVLGLHKYGGGSRG